MTDTAAHSDIEPSDNLLNQIDRAQIAREFRERLSRLGDLKSARNEHEQRNWLGRWWYKGDLEQAQLDAQELQADFAESLAKLMAINLLQSQQLEQQQNQISLQQNKLSEQNERLKNHTEAIARQQEELKKQGDDLENLVNDFFELRGLTQNEARKLIAIANEVKTTKNDMDANFQACVQHLREEQASLKLSIEETVSKVLTEQKLALNVAETSFITRLDAQDSSIAKANVQLTQVFREQSNLLQERVDGIQGVAIAAEQKVGALARQTVLRVWWSLGFAASALALTLGSLIATHRLFG